MQYYYIFSVRLAVKTIHCCQTRLDGTTQSLCSSFCKNDNAKYFRVEKMNRAIKEVAASPLLSTYSTQFNRKLRPLLNS